VSRPPDHAGSYDKTDPDDTGRVVDASCRQIEPALSNDILRGPRSTILPGERHGPARVPVGEETFLCGDPLAAWSSPGRQSLGARGRARSVFVG